MVLVKIWKWPKLLNFITFIKKTRVNHIYNRIWALWLTFSSLTVNTLYNVCSVHWGMFSTLGDVQYIGGISWYMWGDTMSTLGDVQYIGRYHEYIGGCSVHWQIPWVHWGDIMSTSGGYHEYIRGCSVHWGMFSTLGFSIEIERILWSCSHTCIMISLRRYWTSPNVRMISPQCTHGIPPMYWTSSDVLMVSPTFIMISPNVLNTPDVLKISPQCTHDIPRCTEHPPMYWKSNDVLNTHYTGWLKKINFKISQFSRFLLRSGYAILIQISK